MSAPTSATSSSWPPEPLDPVDTSADSSRYLKCEPTCRAISRSTASATFQSPTPRSSDTNGSVEFSLGPQTDSGLGSLRPLGHGRSRTVKTMRFDEMAKPGGRVALVKMDIEGAELKALRGMEGCLRQDRPDLVLEVTDHYLRGLGDSAADLFGFVSGLGYRMWSLPDNWTARGHPQSRGPGEATQPVQRALHLPRGLTRASRRAQHVHQRSELMLPRQLVQIGGSTIARRSSGVRSSRHPGRTWRTPGRRRRRGRRRRPPAAAPRTRQVYHGGQPGGDRFEHLVLHAARRLSGAAATAARHRYGRTSGTLPVTSTPESARVAERLSSGAGIGPTSVSCASGSGRAPAARRVPATTVAAVRSARSSSRRRRPLRGAA